MSDIFLNLFNMSITASWLVLAVVVFRMLFKKAPKSLRIIMWGLVGIRLACPLSIESILSVIPTAELVPPELVNSHSSVDVSGGEILGYIGNNPVYYELGLANGSLTFNEICAPDGDYINPLLIVTYVASIVWLVGVAVMLLYTLISYLKILKNVRAAINIKDNIWICDNVTTPFILGLFKPRIYLPSSMGEQDMEYVIAHEQAHLKRFDHWWKPIGFALLTVYWFNPVLWIGYILLSRDIELACDEKVIKDMDNNDKKGYMETLVNCSSLRRKIMICPLAFGEVSVKGRVKAMLNYKKPAFWVIVVAIIASVTVAVCFLTNPKKDNENTNTTEQTAQGEESTTETTTESTTKSADEESTTESTTGKQESTTKKPNKNETTTKKPENVNSKVKYTTDKSITLEINGSPAFSSKYAYLAVTSPKLKNLYYFKNSVLNTYKAPSYFDSSVPNASALNKSIELQKEFQWINNKTNELGISRDTTSYYEPSGLTTDESTTYRMYLNPYSEIEEKVMVALVDKGTLKIRESERNKAIRNNCYAKSYILFECSIDTPQEVVDAELARIRAWFGKNGINSDEKLNTVYNECEKRTEELREYEGHYSVGFTKATTYDSNFAVDQSLYNVVKEKHYDSSNNEDLARNMQQYIIQVFYDPVDYLDLDAIGEKQLKVDAIRSDYIAYKKRGIDGYTVTLNKENYMNAVK